MILDKLTGSISFNPTVFGLSMLEAKVILANEGIPTGEILTYTDFIIAHGINRTGKICRIDIGTEFLFKSAGKSRVLANLEVAHVGAIQALREIVRKKVAKILNSYAKKDDNVILTREIHTDGVSINDLTEERKSIDIILNNYLAGSLGKHQYTLLSDAVATTSTDSKLVAQISYFQTMKNNWAAFDKITNDIIIDKKIVIHKVAILLMSKFPLLKNLFAINPKDKTFDITETKNRLSVLLLGDSIIDTKMLDVKGKLSANMLKQDNYSKNEMTQRPEFQAMVSRALFYLTDLSEIETTSIQTVLPECCFYEAFIGNKLDNEYQSRMVPKYEAFLTQWYKDALNEEHTIKLYYNALNAASFHFGRSVGAPIFSSVVDSIDAKLYVFKKYPNLMAAYGSSGLPFHKYVANALNVRDGSNYQGLPLTHGNRARTGHKKASKGAPITTPNSDPFGFEVLASESYYNQRTMYMESVLSSAFDNIATCFDTVLVHTLSNRSWTSDNVRSLYRLIAELQYKNTPLIFSKQDFKRADTTLLHSISTVEARVMSSFTNNPNTTLNFLDSVINRDIFIPFPNYLRAQDRSDDEPSGGKNNLKGLSFYIVRQIPTIHLSGRNNTPNPYAKTNAMLNAIIINIMTNNVKLCNRIYKQRSNVQVIDGMLITDILEYALNMSDADITATHNKLRKMSVQQMLNVYKFIEISSGDDCTVLSTDTKIIGIWEDLKIILANLFGFICEREPAPVFLKRNIAIATAPGFISRSLLTRRYNPEYLPDSAKMRDMAFTSTYCYLIYSDKVAHLIPKALNVIDEVIRSILSKLGVKYKALKDDELISKAYLTKRDTDYRSERWTQEYLDPSMINTGYIILANSSIKYKLPDSMKKVITKSENEYINVDVDFKIKTIDIMQAITMYIHYIIEPDQIYLRYNALLLEEIKDKVVGMQDSLLISLYMQCYFELNVLLVKISDDYNSNKDKNSAIEFIMTHNLIDELLIMTIKVIHLRTSITLIATKEIEDKIKTLLAEAQTEAGLSKLLIYLDNLAKDEFSNTGRESIDMLIDILSSDTFSKLDIERKRFFKMFIKQLGYEANEVCIKGTNFTNL